MSVVIRLAGPFVGDYRASIGNSPLATVIRALFLACCSLFLAGFYESSEQFITVEEAVEVPGLAGEPLRYQPDKNTGLGQSSDLRFVFVFDGQSKSYKLGNMNEDGDIDWTPEPVLVMPLRDQFYWLQGRDDQESEFQVILFAFKRGDKTVSGPYLVDMDNAGFRSFLGRHDVTETNSQIERTDTEQFSRLAKLAGSPDNLLAFLKAHATVPLKHFKFY